MVPNTGSQTVDLLSAEPNLRETGLPVGASGASHQADAVLASYGLLRRDDVRAPVHDDWDDVELVIDPADQGANSTGPGSGLSDRLLDLRSKATGSQVDLMTGP